MEKGMPTSESLRLLVTDVNHHVRDFIKRELEKDGYIVVCVSNGMEFCRCLNKALPPHVIVLDPEILKTGGHTLIEEIIRQEPSIQIIFHAYEEFLGELETGENIHVVEKSASSIGSLKEKIRQCTNRKPRIERPTI
jgi:CheY-like chemotaxis protein